MEAENELDKLKKLVDNSHAHIKMLMAKKKELKKQINDELDYYFKLEDKIKTLEKND